MNTVEQDRSIIERFKSGERAAFKMLVEKYKDEAFSLACSIVKDRQLAEDILQEVFIKLIDKIKTFKYQSTFYTWFYRIVVNQCYNTLRKRQRFSTLEAVTLEPEIIEDKAVTNDLRQLINNALNRMKPDEALVLRLFYLSELKIEEVVQITGFSVSKVKVTLHRARKNLATLLKQIFGKELADL